MGLRLRLPATSANLGPGFDTLGLAMALYLKIDAAASDTFKIEATGRNADLVGSLSGNLMLDTYRALSPGGPALQLLIENEIPLGMGCGSSAAALLAGVTLANEFGRLGMTRQELLAEACRREGHPDNVAACFYGGLTVSSMSPAGEILSATFAAELSWRVLMVLPGVGLATEQARALLPGAYSRADAVANVQSMALVVAAFAQGRADLLAAAMGDRLHEPYRSDACALLPALRPLAKLHGVHAVTLSGAGPAVLVILDGGTDMNRLRVRIAELSRGVQTEVLQSRIDRDGMVWESDVSTT